MKTYQTDKEGNKLSFLNNGKTIVIGLILGGVERERVIGIIDIKQKTLILKRSRSMHLLKKANAYGFNYTLIKEATKFNKVHLKDEYNEWIIPNEVILKNGMFLHFVKTHGFELQCFVTLEQLKSYSINKNF